MAALGTGEIAVLAAAGLLGGAGNAAAGGGSLLTFPLLVALGIPPLTANVTNTVGHAPGYLAIVAGLREELAGQRRHILLLTPVAVIGAVLGAALLAVSSDRAFAAIAPYLVLAACALLALQPVLRGWIARRPGAEVPTPLLLAGTLVGCTYAAYFGAGAGFIVLGSLAITIAADLRTLNALSRLLICIANFVALPLLILLTSIDIGAAAVLWPATLIGGYLGARLARRLPEKIFRAAVVTIGLFGTVYLLMR
jgi:uncharacterized membrane protein YfcA